MSFMGFSHLAVLTMTIPSGLRQRSKHVGATEKVTRDVLQMIHRQSTGHVPPTEAPRVVEKVKNFMFYLSDLSRFPHCSFTLCLKVGNDDYR
jgi:hypothetical protein